MAGNSKPFRHSIRLEHQWFLHHSTSCLTIDKPKPVPPRLTRCRALLARGTVKMWSTLSSAMPIPCRNHNVDRWIWCSRGDLEGSTSTLPDSVKLNGIPARLNKIWRVRAESPSSWILVGYYHSNNRYPFIGVTALAFCLGRVIQRRLRKNGLSSSSIFTLLNFRKIEASHSEWWQGAAPESMMICACFREYRHFENLLWWFVQY